MSGIEDMLTRRRLACGLTGIAATLAMRSPLRADPGRAIPMDIFSAPTAQSWCGVWRGSDSEAEAAVTLSRICCDPRTGAVRALDPRLWDILAAVSDVLNLHEWEIISGYRTRQTNASVGGAPNSYHPAGMALDVRVPRAMIDRFAQMARLAGAGGIGIYRAQGFVHIDTRAEPFNWG